MKPHFFWIVLILAHFSVAALAQPAAGDFEEFRCTEEGSIPDIGEKVVCSLDLGRVDGSGLLPFLGPRNKIMQVCKGTLKNKSEVIVIRYVNSAGALVDHVFSTAKNDATRVDSNNKPFDHGNGLWTIAGQGDGKYYSGWTNDSNFASKADIVTEENMTLNRGSDPDVVAKGKQFRKITKLKIVVPGYGVVVWAYNFHDTDPALLWSGGP